MNLPDTPSFKRIERLAQDLRREIEFAMIAGLLQPRFSFEFFVRHSGDSEILKGTFNLEPWKRPAA